METTTPSNDETQTQNSYIIDSERAAELQRLRIQDQLITEEMGGSLPELSDLSAFKRVLDVACGPGDWALTLAQDNPHLEVVGIDISQRMIHFANARRLANTTFRIMDILNPLDFPDESFDIVNARLLFAVLPRSNWLQLLAECHRILRPGGFLRLCESEWIVTNKESNQRFNRLIAQALYRSGHSFSPDGYQIGITPMLTGFLKEGGFHSIRHRAFAIDCSFGEEGHKATGENGRIAGLLLQPFLLKMGVATQEELAELYEQAFQDFEAPDFRACWSFLVAWGRK